MIPEATEGTPLKVYVGGNTAGFEDFSDKVAGRLPLFIGVVIGLSVLLLIAAFRSLWIPLVSAVFNLLSVGAAYGVVVAVFQEGIGASLIGVDSGVPIVSFVPVMLFAILFGLSMDYNVFLLSRIHEAYNEGDGPRASVVHGMARIGKIVLFAGLIMSAVFMSFVTQPDVIGKMFGLGLGLAILIDVLVVRLVIAPAVVTLLGDRAWTLPGWLDRILPNVSLEGHLVQGLDEKARRGAAREGARLTRALLALTALAAALRLPTLGSQSLWLDEVLTARLAEGSLGDLIHRVAEQEANPPLFYLLEWGWTRLAGTSEFALRLPSALFGIALVPVAWAIGRRLGGERAATALAALVAVHPLLVYYSQEARGYAAVALACAVGFLYFLDTLKGEAGGVRWALASAVALGCHYFAIFPIAIEAAILLWRRGRAVLPALAGVAVAGAALLPLVLEQLDGDHGDNVTAGASLAARVKAAATSWLVGERGAAIDGLEWLAGALMLAGVGVVLWRRERAAVLPAAVAGGAVALMLLAAVLGADYLNNRNTLAVLAIALAVPALGFARAQVARRRDLRRAARRDDRRAGRRGPPPRELARRRAGALEDQDAIVVVPAYNEIALRWYAPAFRPVRTARANDVAVVSSDLARNPLPTRSRGRPDLTNVPRARAGSPRRAIAARPPATLTKADLDAGRAPTSTPPAAPAASPCSPARRRRAARPRRRPSRRRRARNRSRRAAPRARRASPSRRRSPRRTRRPSTQVGP